MSLQTEANRIKSAKSAIIESIGRKGVSVPDGAKIDELPPYIDSITAAVLQNKTVTPKTIEQTVIPDKDFDGLSYVTVNPIPSDYVNTNSGDATASDILKDKKAWVDGEEVTGNIVTYDGGALQTRYNRETDNRFVFDVSMPNDRFVKSGDLNAEVPKSDFGDLRAEYAAEGHTFTSENGFCIEGTMPIYDYTPMPARYDESIDTDFVFIGYLENARPTVLEDELFIKVPKTEFGEAPTSFVAEGYTFTSNNGVCIEGTLPMYDYSEMEAEVYENDDEYAYLQTSVTQSIIEDVFYSKVPLASFGDATASDVRNGKTFTSADGVMVEGTYEGESAASCTLVFNVDDFGSVYVAYTKSDGTSHRVILPANTISTIEDVMCGSMFVYDSANGSYSTIHSAITNLGYVANARACIAPTTSGIYTINFDRS